MMNDLHLVERASAGDGEAVRELYERYSGRISAVLQRLAGHDEALAEDWAQEAWVRAIRALPSFRGDSQFPTWLHRIAVNTARNGLRDARRAGEVELFDEHFSVRSGAEQIVLGLTIEHALQRLPQGMRKVLLLHDVQGYTHQEIGKMLGLHAGTCKSQLFKARIRMRRMLAADVE